LQNIANKATSIIYCWNDIPEIAKILINYGAYNLTGNYYRRIVMVTDTTI